MSLDHSTVILNKFTAVMSNISEATETTDNSIEDGISPLMSSATKQIIESIVQLGALPALVVCGVIMNVINMVVFVRQGLSDRINLCLFCLALCDAGYLVFIMAKRFRGILDLIDDSAAEYWRARGYPLISVRAGFLSTANCLTLLISLERCICVVWPLKAKTLISDRAIRGLILLAFVFCFSTNAVYMFRYDVTSYRDPVSNVTRYKVVRTSFYTHHRHVMDFIFENVNMFVPATSVTVVMMATTIIAVRMRSVLAWRKETASMVTNSERREASVTRTLVVVCIIYTFCTLPYVIHSIFRFTVKEFRPLGTYSNSLSATVGLAHVILCVNSSTNFVVYYNMSTKFKETLLEMLKRRKLGQTSISTIPESTLITNIPETQVRAQA